MSRNIVNFAALIKVASVAACGALVAVAACDNGASTTAGSGGTSGAATTSTKGVTTSTTGTPTTTTGTPTTTTGTPTTTTGTPTTTTGTPATTTGGGGTTLDPSATGYVQDTALGITGAWYAYGDNVGSDGTPGPMGKCELAGHTDAECSSITSPVLPPGTLGFPPSTAGAMCLTGNAAVVPMSVPPATGPDYSNVFGIGIGLDLNSVVPDGGTTAVKGVWDSTAHGVTGFSFTITGVPGPIRVAFPIPATDPTGNAWQFPVTADGTYSVHFALDLADSFTPPTGVVQPPFDPTMIESIQFAIPTNTTAAIPVSSMCVSGLTALTD